MRFTKSWSTYPHLREILEKLEDGAYEIKKYFPLRSLPQNARYHAMLSYISKETGNDHETLHELMKKKFLTKKKLVKLGRKKIWSQKVWSTTKLTTKQFIEYNNQVELFFAENWYPIPPVESPEFRSLIDNYS